MCMDPNQFIMFICPLITTTLHKEKKIIREMNMGFFIGLELTLKITQLNQPKNDSQVLRSKMYIIKKPIMHFH